jgi:uncharacterized Fe-S center protein
MSTVWFTDLSASPEMNLPQKLRALLQEAGLPRIFKAGQLVAIKLHFGELGNLAYLRPNYVRVAVDELKKLGAKPFLTDANTLYTGTRSNAVDHLLTAYQNGFVLEVVGAPVIIADGLRGADEVEIPVDGVYVKRAKIGAAVALADALLVMTHFKGHEQVGFGGALKNLGMGAASRAGKLQQHSTSKPKNLPEKCTACGACARFCPAGAITITEHAQIDYARCLGCGQCVAMCTFGAMVPGDEASVEILARKIAEYAKAALNGRPALFVSFIQQVSPDCDCWGMNRPPVAPDLGILASTDPVALDQACIDLVREAVEYDPFLRAHPEARWEEQLAHAERIGLGTRSYELRRILTGLDRKKS